METITFGPVKSPELLDSARQLDWRERALSQALLEEARGSEGEDALLSAIGIHSPNSSAALIYVDRGGLLEFARMHSDSGIRRLVRRCVDYWDSEESALRVYAGWYGFEWLAEKIEIALAPNWGEPSYLVALAENSEVLARFVRAASDYASRPRGRCLRYSEGWASSQNMDAEIGKVTWNDIVLPPETMIGLRDAIEGFRDSRGSFESLGFPWRRGILLIGPPGTGKTMVCKAAASALPEFPFLYVRDLKQRREKDAITEIFARARKLAPCILVFEDLDGFVHESNRSIFLNELDGFRNNEGLLIIASSNHPGNIDEALLKRPSRFDRVVHFGLPKLAERAELCRRILKRPQLREWFGPHFDPERLIEAAAGESEKMTPAYLKEAFLSAALSLAQRGIMSINSDYADEVLTQLAEMKRHIKKMRDPEAAGYIEGADGPFGFRRWE